MKLKVNKMGEEGKKRYWSNTINQRATPNNETNHLKTRDGQRKTINPFVADVASIWRGDNARLEIFLWKRAKHSSENDCGTQYESAGLFRREEKKRVADKGGHPGAGYYGSKRPITLEIRPRYPGQSRAPSTSMPSQVLNNWTLNFNHNTIKYTKDIYS